VREVLKFIKCIYGGGASDKKKEEVLTTKVNTKVLMTDNFFLNIKVLVAKVLLKKGTSDMIPKF
jgi:hypothetical protein